MASASRTGFQLVTTYLALGLDLDEITIIDVTDMIEAVAPLYLSTLGLNPDGTINTAIIGALDYAGATNALAQHLNVIGDVQGVGGEASVDVDYMTAVLARMRDLALADLNYVAADDRIFPETVSDVLLQRGLQRLLELAVTYQLTAVGNLEFPGTFGEAVQPIYARLMERAKALPLAQWRSRQRIIESLSDINSLAGLSGESEPIEGDFLNQVVAAFRQMAAEGRGRMMADEVGMMRGTSGLLGNSELSDLFETRLLAAANAIHTLSGTPWTAEMIPLGKVVGREVLDIEELWRAHPSIDLPQNRRPAALATALDDALIAICQAEGKANPLSELARCYTDYLNSTPDLAFQLALENEAIKLLNAANAIANGYSAQIADADDDDKPFDLSLPEGMSVERVFGTLFSGAPSRAS